jgi:phenylacetate-CoA ligase
MSCYLWAAQQLIFPIADRLRGVPISKRLAELEKSQWWSGSELQAYQNEKLRRLIKHAYENVPYYRRVMNERKIHPDDIRSTAELPRLPILTKETIRREIGNLRATNLSNREMRHGQTGGSTGEPLSFFHSKEAWAIHQACFRRGLRWAGLEWGEPVVSLAGGLLGTARTSAKERLRRTLTRDHFLAAFEIRSDRIPAIYEWLQEVHPKAMLGYTSSLYALALSCARTGKTGLNIPLAFSTAEVLFPFHVEQIKATFGSEVFDYYGCGEINSIAYQCRFRNGYHVSDEKVLIEVLPLTNNDGADYAKGKTGRLLMTDLTNWAFPFIRYENGDSVVLTDDSCPCGRHLSRIEKVVGRIHDFILTMSGDLLPGEFFPHLFKFSHGVEQYQIVQDRIGCLRVLLVAAPDFTKNHETWLVNKIKEYVGTGMDIVVEHVREIPPTSAGKRRITVSHLDPQQLMSASGVVRSLQEIS